jgi:hypothetical protein
MRIYELCYDRDWGMRHPRRPELTWLFDKRLNKEDTERFLKGEGHYNNKAYTWRYAYLEIKSDVLKRFKTQDKNAVKFKPNLDYGLTSRDGNLLRD